MINLLEVLENPTAIALYFIAAVRGLKGNNATEAEMDSKIAEALQFADWLRGCFPGVIWLIPHEHEVIVRGLLKEGLVEKDDVPWAWTWALKRPGLKGAVLWDAHGISEGMLIEKNCLLNLGKPVCTVEQAGDVAEKNITELIIDILAAKGMKE